MECENGRVAATNGDGLCMATPRADPLNWGKAAEELMGSHLDEVKRMVAEYRQPLVKIEGASLRIAQVAAVAAGAGEARVELDESARGRVKARAEPMGVRAVHENRAPKFQGPRRSSSHFAARSAN